MSVVAPLLDRLTIDFSSNFTRPNAIGGYIDQLCNDLELVFNDLQIPDDDVHVLLEGDLVAEALERALAGLRELMRAPELPAQAPQPACPGDSQKQTG